MFKEKKVLLLSILLVIVLVINWLIWSNTRHLQQQVSHLQGELNSLRSEVGSIRGTMQSIKNEDARWWTPGEVEFMDVDREKALTKISWYLREYREGSKVMLNYQPVGKEDYTEIVAEEESKGYFSVVLPVEVPLEHIFDIHLERATKKEHLKDRNLKEVRITEPKPSLKYYISVQDGETIRTSEIRTLDLSKLSFKLFNPLNLRVNFNSNNKITANVHEYKAGNPRYEINEMYLETRKGKKQVLEKWPFKPVQIQKAYEQERFKIYDVHATPSKAYDSLYWVIKYSEGLLVEKEIPQV